VAAAAAATPSRCATRRARTSLGQFSLLYDLVLEYCHAPIACAVHVHVHVLCMYAFRREAAVFHDLTLHSEVFVWPYSSLQRSSRRKTNELKQVQEKEEEIGARRRAARKGLRASRPTTRTSEDFHSVTKRLVPPVTRVMLHLWRRWVCAARACSALVPRPFVRSCCL
jgi:hypothetical protein